jgi:hypothetical protein
MFCSYTIGSRGNASLIQVMDNEKERNGVQAQLIPSDSGVYFGDQMDYEDEEINLTDFLDTKTYSELNDLLLGKQKKLYELTVEMNKREEPYQKEKETSYNIRKSRLEKKKNDKISKLMAEAKRLNDEKKSQVFSYIDQLASNPNFITKKLANKILEEYNNSNEEDGRSEESLKSTYYLDLLESSSKWLGNNYIKLYNFGVNFGEVYTLPEDIDSLELKDMKLIKRPYQDMFSRDGYGFSLLCVDSDDDDDEGVGKIIYSTGFLKEGFDAYFIPPERNTRYAGFLMEGKNKMVIYDFEHNKEYTIDATNENKIIGGLYTNSDYVLFYGDTDGIYCKYVVINKKLGEIVLDKEDDTFSMKGSHCYDENGDASYRRVASFFSNGKTIVFDSGIDEPFNISYDIPLIVNVPQTIVGMDCYVIVKRGVERASNFYLKQKNSDGFIVFGDFGFADFGSRNDGSLSLTKVGKIIKYYIEENKYILFTEKGKEGECDKYGRTEKDMMALKNFEKWREQGGHSPEAKAQMDKMWGERDIDSHNAFTDWDDADRNLDDISHRNIGEFPKEFVNGLQNFKDDKNWRGAVGFKDPVGYSQQMLDALTAPGADINKIVNGEIPDNVRRNPFFRVDKYGKPMDQPWYDEDEIPAVPSDRVGSKEQMRESLKIILDKLLN